MFFPRFSEAPEGLLTMWNRMHPGHEVHGKSTVPCFFCWWEIWNMTFLFKGVIFRFQPLVFWGCKYAFNLRSTYQLQGIGDDISLLP